MIRGSARNFNPDMATAGKVTIAEVEEIVENGEIDPANVHIPGIYVQRIVKGEKFEKRIEVSEGGLFYMMWIDQLIVNVETHFGSRRV